MSEGMNAWLDGWANAFIANLKGLDHFAAPHHKPPLAGQQQPWKPDLLAWVQILIQPLNS